MSSEASEPDVSAAWAALRRIAQNLPTADDPAQMLEKSLEVVAEAVAADRALALLRNDDGVLVPVRARGKKVEISSADQIEISRSVAARALAEERTVMLRPIDEVSPSQSMVFHGIHLAVAAPLTVVRWGGSAASLPDRSVEVFGVLYIDHRRPRLGPSALVRDLVEAAAQVLGAVLTPYQKLAQAREDLRAVRVRDGGTHLPLEQLLAPRGCAHLAREVRACLRSEAPVLIVGESGTGKTELAAAMAEASGRSPTVRATLGSSDDLNTVTSELFGHERGSFSGAFARRSGLVEYADGGTLILDEVLNLPLQAQQLLLDFTQFGTYRPLGWERREPKRAHARILAATQGSIDEALATGRLRQDLYYRLAHTVLLIPPLRDRREDLPDLVRAVVARLEPRRTLRIAPALLSRCARYEWPGNVRQLEAILGRARDRARAESADFDALTESHVTEADFGVPGGRAHASKADARVQEARAPAQQAADDRDPSPALRRDAEALATARAEVDDRERDLVQRALDLHGGVVAHAARSLGWPRTSLASRIDALGLGKTARKKR